MPDTGDAERLVVLLEARIRDFEKNMQKAEKTADGTYSSMRRGSRSATKQMEEDMVRSTGRINQALALTSTKIGAWGNSLSVGALSAVGGMLTLSAAIGRAKDALDKFGSIADQSAAAGVDAEFFQGIAYQAGLSGVEIDATASALATFAKNAGLAAEGKGKMVSALQALNPELLDNIRNASTQEERIRLAADAINEAKSAAEAAALATTLFGESGTKLVAAFQGGATALDGMIVKAKEMGLIVDREMVARADELGDKLETAQQIVDLKLNRAFVDLAPLMVDAVNWASEFARLLAVAYEQTKSIEQRQFVRPLQNDLADTYNQIGALKDRVAEYNQEIADGNQAPGLRFDITEAERNIETLTAKADALLKRIQILQGWKPPEATGSEVADPFAGMMGRGGPGRTKPVEPFYTPGGDKPSQVATVKVELAEATTAADGFAQMMTSVSSVLDGANDPMLALQHNMDTLGALLNGGQISWEQYGSAVERANLNAASSVVSSISQITGVLAGAFEDNKALAAANVVVSTAAGMMKAYEQGGMFATPMALAIGVAGAAQLASVLGAKPGSASLSGTGAAAAGGGQQAPQAATQQNSQQVIVQLHGQPSDKISIRDLNKLLMETEGKQIVVKYINADSYEVMGS